MFYIYYKILGMSREGAKFAPFFDVFFNYSGLFKVQNRHPYPVEHQSVFSRKNCVISLALRHYGSPDCRCVHISHSPYIRQVQFPSFLNHTSQQIFQSLLNIRSRSDIIFPSLILSRPRLDIKNFILKCCSLYIQLHILLTFRQSADCRMSSSLFQCYYS